MSKLKIGHGFDIHPLVEGRPCIIGGVHIPFNKGLKGHSDADVLLHAICDALIGAMGLGDIGQLFPDNDQKFKDIIISKIPSARLGETYDVANAVLFLCSNESDYINGETLHVNGGLYMA